MGLVMVACKDPHLHICLFKGLNNIHPDELPDRGAHVGSIEKISKDNKKL